MTGGAGTRRRRAAAVLIVAVPAMLGAGIWAPGTACACSCAALAPESIVAQAPVLVVGTPVAVTEHGVRATYTIDVARSYKQAVPSRITVDTPSSSAACGLSLELHTTRTLVLGGPAGGGAPAHADWTATLCWNLASPEVLTRHAGPAITPLPAADSNDDPGGLSAAGVAGIVVGAVGGLVVLAAAGWLLVRRFR
ncbi:hypothetical protein [Gordonia sp. (in: high G+C Gram-positive bacteria)]|uniref:hypothetical protein n=1 Tax=Gordonia sp. (in: high G+C Gram-positive bacteria) TaxID=84139 RepID=UPI0035296DC6